MSTPTIRPSAITSIEKPDTFVPVFALVVTCGEGGDVVEVRVGASSPGPPSSAIAPFGEAFLNVRVMLFPLMLVSFLGS